MKTNFMIENQDAFKQRALERRNRGYHTGKMAAGWEFVRPDPEKGSWSHHVESAKAAWQCVKGGALQSYLLAVFPERYSDETLDDVLAERNAREAQAIADTF